MQVKEWQHRAYAHKLRAQQWTLPRKERKFRGEREPVFDFLFEYYPYSPTKLEQWFPGIGVDLEVDESSVLEHSALKAQDGFITLDPRFLEKHARRIDFVISLLSGVQERPANLNCFGLHEWAMVYQSMDGNTRHPDPLRLDNKEIVQVVNDVGLRCTHIDAYRFFTPEAIPLNVLPGKLQPTRENQVHLDQRGCLHANMDLYKYCMWFQPLFPGELVLDCFELAVRARQLDMQASPYDLTEFGYQPIPIETPEGRAAYAKQQRELATQAEPLRQWTQNILSLSKLSTQNERT